MIGIDEVGRGCFAGPLVVAAVNLEVDIEGLRDSKKLSSVKRQVLEGEIRNHASEIGIAWVSADKIDQIGLADAMKLAVNSAFSSLSNQSVDIVVDGNINYLSHLQNAKELPKADDSIPAVMAASIIAKQARDRYMQMQDVRFPEYNFAKNVGYGTADHRNAIEQHGVSHLHRLSYKPLQKYAKQRGQS